MSRSFREIAAGMATGDLAAALGVSRSLASMIRNGRRNVTVARLQAFADHCRSTGVTLDMSLSVAEEAARITRKRELRGGLHGNA